MTYHLARRSSLTRIFATLILISITSIAIGFERTQSTHLLAEGTRFETEYHVIETGEEGPCVLVVGGMHGNEPAGVAAARQIRDWPIERGRLIVVPRANKLGLEANTRYQPGVDSAVRDLNRNFLVENGEVKPRGEIATALWNLVLEEKPNWVIDLHEGYEFNVSHEPKNGGSKSVGSSLIFSRKQSGMLELADSILEEVNGTISNANRKWTALSSGPVKGSLASACITQLEIPAVIIESTFKSQPLSLRSRQHRMVVSRILQKATALDQSAIDFLTNDEADVLNIALFDGAGTGANGIKNLGNLFSDDQVDTSYELHQLGPHDFNAETLKPFDLVIFPGGSGSAQAKALSESGRRAVVEFVDQGGGYVGICAGAYLCSAHYSWSLHIINTSVFTGAREIEGVGRKQMWFRGPAKKLDVSFSEIGKEMIEECPTQAQITYHNGPIVSPANKEELPPYQVVATFTSETWRWEPQKGTQLNTPAIVAAPFGEGRVVSISPHPESSPSLGTIVQSLAEWAAQQEAALAQ